MHEYSRSPLERLTSVLRELVPDNKYADVLAMLLHYGDTQYRIGAVQGHDEGYAEAYDKYF